MGEAGTPTQNFPATALLGAGSMGQAVLSGLLRPDVAVDGGMSDNLRPMLYGSRYEAVIANRAAARPEHSATIAGKHCESGDVLVADTLLADPVPGDILVTPATGAYGYSMANNYNGVPRPPVVFCEDGDARIVVRREEWEDLVVRDV